MIRGSSLSSRIPDGRRSPPAPDMTVDPLLPRIILAPFHPPRPMHIAALPSFNLAIVILFLGKFLSERIPILRKYNIPEPVSSGLLICLLTWFVFGVSGVEISFDLRARDVLLVYFFAGIGLNSDFRSLLAGGLPLVILIGITVVYMFLQNFTGVGVASLFGLDSAIGVLGGTTSLIGGHGTAIAWTPTFRDEYRYRERE